MNLHGMMHDRAPVAQLDRAPDFESVGRRFESCRARQAALPLGTPRQASVMPRLAFGSSRARASPTRPVTIASARSSAG